eukprot:3821295-Amphidinium_carterae.1
MAPPHVPCQRGTHDNIKSLGGGIKPACYKSTSLDQTMIRCKHHSLWELSISPHLTQTLSEYTCDKS